MQPKKARIRRTATEAKTLILECAEHLLVSEGPAAVQMRAVARQAGLTDAGIAHHFGNREGLLTALLNYGAQKVQSEVQVIVSTWLQATPDISLLIDKLGAMYAKGYAKLALQLHSAGWQHKGSPLLEPAVQGLLSINKNPSTTESDIRLALASLHLWLALDPLFGSEFRKSTGLRSTAHKKNQSDWWEMTLRNMLQLP